MIDKEKRKASQARFHELHPGKRAEWTRKWRERSPEAIAAWRSANAEKIAQSEQKRRLKQYGLDMEQFSALADLQGRRCAICDRPEAEMTRGFHVDHDHETGRVRGLLCLQCNSAIGLLQEDPSLFARAVAYLSKL